MSPTPHLLALALFPVPHLCMATPLEITGELVPTTCEVVAQGGALTVAMGRIDVATINTGMHVARKEFSIDLDCAGVAGPQQVGIRFSGRTDGSSGNLALTPGGAGNVGVALYDAAGNRQQIGKDPLQWLDITAFRRSQLVYSASYASPAGNATAGPANASADLVVVYK